MTSLVKDLPDGVRLIQLMVRLAICLPVPTLGLRMSTIGQEIMGECYPPSSILRPDVLHMQVTLPLDATTRTHACGCRK